MSSFTQATRALKVFTPLGPDVLLLEQLTGTEALSELFRFELHLLAQAPVDFDRILNQSISVRMDLSNGESRFIHGMVSRFSQGREVPVPGQPPLFRHTAELVPTLWRLTQRVRCRIYQRRSVPEILRDVIADEWKLPVLFRLTGSYPSRDYCVQYQEADFAFISRLMEDEGIFYYFMHEPHEDSRQERHVLVVTDDVNLVKDLPLVATAEYDAVDGGTYQKPRVWEWEKQQSVAASAHAAHDYHFEVPHNRLEGRALIHEKVDVGTVRHRLHLSHRPDDAEMLEVTHPIGSYAHHFDELDASGSPRHGEMEQLFQEGERTARLRAEEAATSALHIHGAGNLVAFQPGHPFALAHHFNANGRYLLTRVEHQARQDYLVGSDEAPRLYENRFECLPESLPFRPRRVTPRPRIDGTQTAAVVAPRDLHAFLDRYGRVKVKFHWDRSATGGADSSCWLRVAQPWAGKRWGAFFWPRAGHEVVVSFQDGDPDRPIVIGSVYNAENMPAVSPAEHPTANGFKSCSFGRDPSSQSNSLVFHDEHGDEHVHLHSETHEVVSSNLTKYANTPGPSLRFSGILPVPPGSGGGGGWLEYNTLAGVVENASNPLTLVLPGDSSYTCGERFQATIAGGRNTHVLGGGDVKVVFDIESILETLGSLGPFGPLVETLAGVGLFGVGGDTGLVFGSKNQSTFGPSLNFRAAQSFEYRFESKDDHEAPDRVLLAYVWLVAALVVIVAMAGDILARVFATIKEPEKEPASGEEKPSTSTPKEEKTASSSGDKHAEESGKEVVDEIPEWAILVGVALAGRVHALLLVLEMAVADLERKKTDTVHGGHLIEEWLEIAKWNQGPRGMVPKKWFEEQKEVFDKWKDRVKTWMSKPQESAEE